MRILRNGTGIRRQPEFRRLTSQAERIRRGDKLLAALRERFEFFGVPEDEALKLRTRILEIVNSPHEADFPNSSEKTELPGQGKKEGRKSRLRG